MSRYARQILPPEIGIDGQDRLRRAHVLVIGAGGLGCPALQYLTGAGIGRITVLDPDLVEEHNLHRQPLYRMCDLGRPKAEAARDALEAYNPEVAITALVAPLTPSSVSALVAAAEIVVDAADSFAVSYILSDACMAADTPLIAASVLGQSGYAGGFCGPAPSLRAVFPELPASGATCATAGVIGPAGGMIGTLQAQLVLRVLLGGDPSPSGQMVTLDLQRLRFGGFSFMGSPEPDSVIPFLDAAQIGARDQVFDLRGPDEAPMAAAPGALRATSSEVTQMHFAPETRVVLCCSTGLRAWRAADDLRRAGHGNLALLAATAST
jgi:molybdopterin/thiamine biosynthesis adenylyltransferase